MKVFARFAVFVMLASAAMGVSAADTAALSVSDKGVGGITSATRFSQAEIRKALKGYDIKADKRSTEGEPYPVFLVMDQKKYSPPSTHRKTARKSSASALPATRSPTRTARRSVQNTA